MNLIHSSLNDIDRLFDSFFSYPRNREKNYDFTPVIDVVEKENKYLIQTELPGVDKTDIKVELHDGVLSIEGEKKTEHKDEKRHRTERSYGKFVRKLSLPDGTKEESLKAEFQDGVLHISIEKEEAKQPKEIPVI